MNDKMSLEDDINKVLAGVEKRKDMIKWHIEEGHHEIIPYLFQQQAIDLVRIEEFGLKGSFDKYYQIFCQQKRAYENRYDQQADGFKDHDLI